MARSGDFPSQCRKSRHFAERSPEARSTKKRSPSFITIVNGTNGSALTTSSEIGEGDHGGQYTSESGRSSGRCQTAARINSHGPASDVAKINARVSRFAHSFAIPLIDDAEEITNPDFVISIDVGAAGVGVSTWPGGDFCPITTGGFDLTPVDDAGVPHFQAPIGPEAVIHDVPRRIRDATALFAADAKPDNRCFSG